MNRVLGSVKNWRARLSREGRLGIGLLLICLAAYITVVSPLDLQQSQLQRDVDNLDRQAHNTGLSQTGPSNSADELVSYYKFFPSQTTAPKWLNVIYNAARTQHLDLPEGKYRVVRERAGKLLRYEATLPVTGSYRQLHRFIAVVLSEIPVAALDGVTFERSKISNTLIDAKFKISLYLGQAS